MPSETLVSQENRLIQFSMVLKGESPDKKRYSDETLLLESFTGQEGIAMPFHFDLILRSLNQEIKLDDVVGRPATIKMVLPDSQFRFIDGIISSFVIGDQTVFKPAGEPNSFTLTSYQAALVPQLWILTRNQDCRIFQ